MWGSARWYFLSRIANLNINILAFHAFEIVGVCIVRIRFRHGQTQLCLGYAWIIVCLSNWNLCFFINFHQCKLWNLDIDSVLFFLSLSFMDSVILFAFINSIFCVQTKATHTFHSIDGDSVEPWQQQQKSLNAIKYVDDARRRYNSIEPRQRNQSSSSCSTCSQRRISLWTIYPSPRCVFAILLK